MKNKKLFLSLKLTIAVVFLVVSFAFSQTKIEWKEFITEQELTEEISQFKQKGKEVKENKELLDISQQFLEESEKINKEWKDKYFQLINQVHTANDNYARYKSLKTSISYLEKSLKQINDNIDSLETIYKNRLKAIPTSYLILSKVPISTEESKNSVTRKLMDSTKKFIADTYSAAMVFSKTEVKNYQIVIDLIELVEGGRVESFETDPIWFTTEDENFYLLQKYRLYPDFKDKEKIKSSKKIKESYDNISFFKIKNLDDTNLPQYWIKNSDYQKQVNTFVTDVKEANKKTAKKLSDMNLEYIDASKQLSTKKRQIENELKAKEEEFNNLSNYGKIDLEKELNDAETALNTHVSSREILVFTILSELEQSGRSPEEQFKELISQAYTNLINRATSLKSYKFYRVVNHTLESYKAEEFYDKVMVISYSLPLRRRTYREEEGGLARLGVILALKVKFESSIETGQHQRLQQ